MPTARTSRSPSTCRARACIGAAIARRPARRRCARTSPPESCCAPAGRRSRKARRGVPRSHVRLGHAGHRSGDDRGQRRARRAPALFRILRLGGSRPRRLGTREARSAGARAKAHACDCAASMRIRRVLAAARDNAARAGLGELINFDSGRLADAKPAGEGVGISRHQSALRRAARRPRDGARA